MNNIETLSNYHQLEIEPVLAKIKKLQFSRPYRDRKRLFFAEGIRNFVEAVDHNFLIDTIFYSEKLLINPIARKLVRRLKREGIAFTRVSPEQFRSVSLTERASGVAAIFHQQIKKLNEINPSEHICWTVLNQIRSLGNLGTLLRTSAAAGSSGFIFIGNSIDPFDPNVVRATMGAIFKQTIIKASAEELRKWINFHKLTVVGAAANGDIDYNQISYAHPTIIMLGNERAGLSQEQLSMCHNIVRIPMVAGTDSLNVAVAGSLLLYEVFRPPLLDQKQKAQ